jgi:GT2 family glycosyltransferase
VLICLDHDVVVHERFLEDHYREHEKAEFKPLLFMGRRVDLSPELSQAITPENVCEFNSGKFSGLNWKIFKSGLTGETKNVMRSLRLDAPTWLTRLLKRDRVWDLLGSNFSISMASMLQVNGYNEDYQSYWGEDGDLFVRVRNSGISILGRIGYAVQWHLFHKRLEETPEHIQMYKALLEDRTYLRCKNGIDKN